MGNYIGKEPCEKCGSRDNVAVYTDGKYCYSCQEQRPTGGAPTPTPKTGLLDFTYVDMPVRGLKAKACCKMGLAYGHFKGQKSRIFNMYDTKGNLIKQTVQPNGDKSQTLQIGDTKSLRMFGQSSFNPQPDRFITITEGQIDAVSIYQQTGYAVVSVTRGAAGAAKEIKANLQWFQEWEYVVLCFDNDESGQKAINECVDIFPPGKVRIANPTGGCKDANEMLLAGFGSKEFKQMLWSAKAYRPDNIVLGRDLDWYSIVEATPRGADLPYPELSAMMRGLHKRRITLVTAQSKAGKSTFCKEIAYHLITNGLKVGNIFLEEDQKETVHSYVAMHKNIPHWEVWENPKLYIDPENPPEYLNNDNISFYDHFGSVDSENLLKKIEYMAVADGMDFVILDHISIVVSGMETSDERRGIDVLMTKLRSLVQRVGVGIVLVCHCKQVPLSEKLTMFHLRGSGSLAQLSDFVLTLSHSRDLDGAVIENEREVEIVANRYTGKIGICDTLSYNQFTGRLLPQTGEEL